MQAQSPASCNRNDVFFQVPQIPVPVSAGPVNLPIFYYDASALYAFFLVDQARVRPLLEGSILDPGMRLGGKAIVGLACYEYRDTSVGVYNEVGLALAVARQGESLQLGGWRDVLGSFTRPEERQSGLYVLDLPVTTPLANAAGREIWGFPKFVTPIRYAQQGRRFLCSVENPEGGHPLMSLSGTMGLSMPGLPFSLTLYSCLAGQWLRCTVNARGKSHLALPGDLRLKVGTGNHRMEQHLRQLGLEDARPLAVLWTDRFQSRLNGGVPVPGADVAQRAATPI